MVNAQYASVTGVPSGSVLSNTLVQDWIDDVEAVATFTPVATLDSCVKTDDWYYPEKLNMVTGLRNYIKVTAETTFQDIIALGNVGFDDNIVLIPNFTFNINVFGGALTSAPTVIATVTDGVSTSVDGKLVVSVDSYLCSDFHTGATNRVLDALTFTLAGATQEEVAFCTYDLDPTTVLESLKEYAVWSDFSGTDKYIAPYWYTADSHFITTTVDPVFVPVSLANFHLLNSDKLTDFLGTRIQAQNSAPFTFDGWFIGETEVTVDTVVTADTTVEAVYTM